MARRVLIVGGGVAGLEATLALRAFAGDRVSVGVVAPEADFSYRPLAVAEPFHAAEMRQFPLRSLVEAAGAELIRGRVASVDPERGDILTELGERLQFDALLLTAGTTRSKAVQGALTFCGPEDDDAVAALLESASTGGAKRIVFALPAAVTWLLPLYELALQTGMYLSDRGTMDIALMVVTSEESPLGIFGIQASEAIRELLDVRGIGLRTHTTPISFEGGTLHVVPEETIIADQVVALPRLEGTHIEGLPYDAAGFVRTDEFCRVDDLDAIYAAGDMTAFPIKQGGIAAQQADVAAAGIAAEAGASVERAPFKPVLRGLLLTGIFERYLYAEPGTATSMIATEAFWWPPAKIAGHHLAPFLAEHLGLENRLPDWALEGTVPVELEFEPHSQHARSGI